MQIVIFNPRICWDSPGYKLNANIDAYRSAVIPGHFTISRKKSSDYLKYLQYFNDLNFLRVRFLSPAQSKNKNRRWTLTLRLTSKVRIYREKISCSLSLGHINAIYAICAIAIDIKNTDLLQTHCSVILDLEYCNLNVRIKL